MKIRDIMTPEARCVEPETSLREAAQTMRSLDVGSVPICERDRLIGILTDRDIVLRAVAEGLDPDRTTAREVMSKGILYVFEDQDVEQAASIFEDEQIRRLPVLNRDKRLVGMVSLGDLAVKADAQRSGQTLREVSQPAEPATR